MKKATATARGGECAVCGTPLNPLIADLGCPVCLLQTGIENATTHQPAVAEQFGPYAIAQRDDGSPDELGRGSMGITFRAVDTTLNRAVALKIINPREHGNDHTRERFMREARAAAGLRHQNIATIHHFGVHEATGEYFYAMELVEGETLEERVRRCGPMDARTVVKIAQQVVAALAVAERSGLIHRDLKPANIMLVKKEGAEQTVEVKIIDFGLAKAVSDEGNPMAITRDGFVGSPLFASPEQFGGASIDVRSDIFSLGVTLWFALTGRTPFPGRDVQEIQTTQKIGALPVKQLKSARVPPRFIVLLKTMLAFEPAARPGPVELAERLQICASRRGKLRPILATAALLLIGTLVVFVARTNYRVKPVRSQTAREAFLKGQYFWNKRNGSDFQTAKGYFEKAIALDPNYAQAYAGLADAYQFIANADRKLRDEYYAKARRLSQRALELDSTLAEPHASLGLIAMNYDWDWPRAEREFKRAIELNPRYATAHHWYAAYLDSQGKFDEALREIEQARQLEPLSSIINTDAAQILYFAGRLPEAKERLEETLKLDPGFSQAHYWLGSIFAAEKDYDRAIEQLKLSSWQGNDAYALGRIGLVYGLTGKRKEAEEQVALLNAKFAKDQSTDREPLVEVYMGLGRNDEALACLEEEYRAHSTSLTSLKVNPDFGRLRSDPRYVDLMRRVHLIP